MKKYPVELNLAFWGAVMFVVNVAIVEWHIGLIASPGDFSADLAYLVAVAVSMAATIILVLLITDKRLKWPF